MTVKQLIKILSNCNEDSKIVIFTEGNEELKIVHITPNSNYDVEIHVY